MGKHVVVAFDSVDRSALARKMGVNRTHVSRVLSGHNVPSLMVANQMAVLMGISLDDFHGQWECRSKEKRQLTMVA